MSRYRWPEGGVTMRRDRARRRAAYRANLLRAVPPEVIQRALEQRAEARTARASAAALFRAPAGDTNLWLPLGPTSVILGQAGSRPRVAGRVRDLRVSPNGQRAYAATANGGVWFSA